MTEPIDHISIINGGFQEIEYHLTDLHDKMLVTNAARSVQEKYDNSHNALMSVWESWRVAREEFQNSMIRLKKLEDIIASKSKIFYTLREVLNAYSANTISEFARNIYKYTDCGANVSFLTPNGAIHKKYVCASDLAKGGDEADTKDLIDKCIGIRFGSIVEGSDAEVLGDLITFPTSQSEVAESLKYVEGEAKSLWEEANSEEEESE